MRDGLNFDILPLFVDTEVVVGNHGGLVVNLTLGLSVDAEVVAGAEVVLGAGLAHGAGDKGSLGSLATVLDALNLLLRSMLLGLLLGFNRGPLFVHR